MQGYRTYIVAGLMAIFSVLAIADWNMIISDPKAGMVGLASAVIMAVLRSITTTPPATKSEDVTRIEDDK